MSSGDYFLRTPTGYQAIFALKDAQDYFLSAAVYFTPLSLVGLPATIGRVLDDAIVDTNRRFNEISPTFTCLRKTLISHNWRSNSHRPGDEEIVQLQRYMTYAWPIGPWFHDGDARWEGALTDWTTYQINVSYGLLEDGRILVVFRLPALAVLEREKSRSVVTRLFPGSGGRLPYGASIDFMSVAADESASENDICSYYDRNGDYRFDPIEGPDSVFGFRDERWGQINWPKNRDFTKFYIRRVAELLGVSTVDFFDATIKNEEGSVVLELCWD